MRAFRWLTQFLCGHDGRPSHPKLMQWAVVASYLVPAVTPVPPGIAVTVIAASFGYKAWSDIVSRSSFGFTTTTAVDVAHRFERKVEERVDDVRRTIVDNRDPELGFDPSQPRPEAQP